MNLSAPFIRRPIATSLLAVALFLSGVAAFTQLPVGPLPKVDLATINVNNRIQAALPRLPEEMRREGVRVHILGRREGLPKDILDTIEHAERSTEHNERFNLQVAFNSGGANRVCGSR